MPLLPRFHVGQPSSGFRNPSCLWSPLEATPSAPEVPKVPRILVPLPTFLRDRVWPSASRLPVLDESLESVPFDPAPGPAAPTADVMGHFRHLVSNRIQAARDAPPGRVARSFAVGRIARKPRGTDRSHVGPWALSRSRAEPSARAEATSPLRKMAIAMLEQRSDGGPGDRGGMGAPAGHRFCADAVVGYCRKATPGRRPGSSGIPPARRPPGPGVIETGGRRNDVTFPRTRRV